MKEWNEHLKRRDQAASLKEWFDEVGRKVHKLITEDTITRTSAKLQVLGALDREEQLRAMMGANAFGIAIEKLPIADFFKVVREACGDLKEINPKVAAILKPSASEKKVPEKKIPSFEEMKGRYLDLVNAALVSVDPEADLRSINLIKSALVANNTISTPSWQTDGLQAETTTGDSETTAQKEQNEQSDATASGKAHPLVVPIMLTDWIGPTEEWIRSV
ncbi:hypothetical protein HDU93_000341 [Gonapodya sp. JEL0774]|nr:hypothetical protein HDU93_000341 [Gonapodya sp. JEL0774]